MKTPVISNLVYLAAVVAHIPLFIGYVRINAAKGHYQFFPILVAVALWLIFDRLNAMVVQKKSAKSGIWNWLSSGAQHTQQAEKSAGLAVALFGIAAIVLGIAAVVQSSFMVIPSIMVLAASWIISRYGIRGFKISLPAWMLLLLAIPFPWNLDAVLVNRMQFLASSLASLMLDSLGQIHFREGLTLVTAKQQFFTEEACSGIRSLFSSLATLSVFGVYHRLSLPRHIFNWLQVILWVIVGNAIRIAIVVFVAENWTQSIASGAPHEMLGIGVFASIVLVALSTSMAIDKLYAGEADQFGDSAIDTEIESHVVDTKSEIAVPPKWISVAAMCFFALVLMFCIRMIFVSNAIGPPQFSKEDIVSAGKEALPESIEGWTVANFEKKTRPQSSLLAPNSSIWTLTDDSGSGKVVVSLDSPYGEFHDLTTCYNGLGWNVSSEYDLASSSGDSGDKLCMLNMFKRSQHGVVFFSAYGNDGKEVSRAEFFSKTGNARKNILLAFGIGDNRSRLPVTQVQLVYENSKTISDKKKAELRKLFEQVRLRLKSAIYSSMQGNG